eukprot:COSAG05_NODE_7587_length_793_cov_1.110951_1_plen_82_part_10
MYGKTRAIQDAASAPVHRSSIDISNTNRNKQAEYFKILCMVNLGQFKRLQTKKFALLIDGPIHACVADINGRSVDRSASSVL